MDEKLKAEILASRAYARANGQKIMQIVLANLDEESRPLRRFLGSGLTPEQELDDRKRTPIPRSGK